MMEINISFKKKTIAILLNCGSKKIVIVQIFRSIKLNEKLYYQVNYG